MELAHLRRQLALQRGQHYKSPKIVVDTLVDIVSRNGNLLLNFPLRSNGTLDAEELAIMDALGAWFAVNGEAIYGTRPWKTFGEGLSAAAPRGRREVQRGRAQGADVGGRAVHDEGRRALRVRDGVAGRARRDPGPRAGRRERGPADRARRARRGSAPLKFTQDAGGLAVELPPRAPSDLAVALKIAGV